LYSAQIELAAYAMKFGSTASGRPGIASFFKRFRPALGGHSHAREQSVKLVEHASKVETTDCEVSSIHDFEAEASTECESFRCESMKETSDSDPCSFVSSHGKEHMVVAADLDPEVEMLGRAHNATICGARCEHDLRLRSHPDDPPFSRSHETDATAILPFDGEADAVAVEIDADQSFCRGFKQVDSTADQALPGTITPILLAEGLARLHEESSPDCAPPMFRTLNSSAQALPAWQQSEPFGGKQRFPSRLPPLSGLSNKARGLLCGSTQGSTQVVEVFGAHDGAEPAYL
jgi:hypothetical protein